MEIPTEVTPHLMPTRTYNNDVPQETYRTLIGWTNDQLSIEARSSLITATPEQHLQAILACRTQVASRPAFTSTNPITEIEGNDLVETIKARPETYFIDTEVKNAGGSWRFAKVNLKDVIAYQPIVQVDNLEAQKVHGSLGDEQLYELCFPSSRPVSFDEVTIQADDKGYTITTLDPNIRVAHWHHIPKVPPVNLDLEYPIAAIQYPGSSSPFLSRFLPFALMRSPNYLQVVHFQDRYFLREGYNRSASLLSQGICHVPCMLIETQHPTLIGLRPDMLGPEIVLSSHPPKLGDFWDDTITCLWQRPALRHVYRISMEIMHVLR